MRDERPTIFVPNNPGFFIPDNVRAEFIEVYPAAHKERGPRRAHSPRTANPADRWTAWRPDWIKFPEGWAEQGDGDGGPDGPLSVPPEILALAEKAMTHWHMKVSGMSLAATKPEKGWGAIWRIETDQGPRSFKLLHRPFERNLFSIHAQEYLTQRKFRVAPLVQSKKGQLYAVVDNRMFICTDWIEGLHPASKVTLEGAAQLCYGLGEFHRYSQGYRPPDSAHFASRMHRWPSVYKKVRTKLDWFEHLAHAYPEMPASGILLQVLDYFRNQADEALVRLERSAYRELVARGPQAWGLVHQDGRSIGLTGSWVRSGQPCIGCFKMAVLGGGVLAGAGG